MTDFYKEGVLRALEVLGLKEASATSDPGTPFPTKSKNIPDERLADLLQQQTDDEEIALINPENGRWRNSGKNVTWSAPINLTGLDEGHPIAGFYAPINPRG